MVHAQEDDEERQRWIEQYGIKFLRITNDDVRKNLIGVLDVIIEAVSISKTDQSTPLSRWKKIHRDISPWEGEKKKSKEEIGWDTANSVAGTSTTGCGNDKG